jgi:hypothetical protein
VTDGFFVIGLSAVDPAMQRNEQLLKERSWLYIPSSTLTAAVPSWRWKRARPATALSSRPLPPGKEITNDRPSVTNQRNQKYRARFSQLARNWGAFHA